MSGRYVGGHPEMPLHPYEPTGEGTCAACIRAAADNVAMPSMGAAMLTALTPSLQPTGEHKPLPDGYCPDCCGAPCIKTWLGREAPKGDTDGR